MHAMSVRKRLEMTAPGRLTTFAEKQSWKNGKTMEDADGGTDICSRCGVYLHFENKITDCHRTCDIRSGHTGVFDGYQIIQISDLHNTGSDKVTADLIAGIKERKPDLIVITGDLIDSRHADADRALDTVRQIAGMCPIFYVTGNHEGTRR